MGVEELGWLVLVEVRVRDRPGPAGKTRQYDSTTGQKRQYEQDKNDL
jgi:hypothetical protein